MKTDKTRFHPSWMSYQYLFIPYSSTKVLPVMQKNTKKATLITDELYTKVMTSLDLFYQH